MRGALPRVIRRWHWLLAGVVVAGLGGMSLYANSTAFSRPDERPLASLLESRGITAVYGDYWTIYPLMYDSDEQIIGVAVREDLGNLQNNRYPPYLRMAAASRHSAWVVQTGSSLQAALLRCFARLGSTYTVVTWHDQTIYDHPTERAYPWWNGGRCMEVT
jgi:hypothetical protein